MNIIQKVNTRKTTMGHSQADKAHSRERILRKAADAVRDTGLESVSVGKLMRSVYLTHGGFTTTSSLGLPCWRRRWSGPWSKAARRPPPA